MSRWRVVLLFAVAIAFRLPAATGGWMDDDEHYTGRDVFALFRENPPDSVRKYPLSFAAARLSVELGGLSPFTLRLPALICGILAPWLLFRLGRRIVGRERAWWGALLLACWPWHQYFSGTARYYAPLFLIGTVSLGAAYRMSRFPTTAHLARFLVPLGISALVHPTGVLSGAGVVMGFAGRKFPRVRERYLIAGLIALTGVTAAVRQSSYWHPIERVLTGTGGNGESLAGMIFGLGLNVTPLLTAMTLIGVWALLRERRRSGLFLLASWGGPLLVLLVVSLFGYVQPRYLFAAAPALLLMSGAGLERLIRPFQGLGRVLVAFACIAPWLPSLASNCIDGNRHDVTRVAETLRSELDSRQLLFAESHGTLRAALYGFHRALPPGEGDPPHPAAFLELPPSPAELGRLFQRRARSWFVLTENDYDAPPDEDYVRFVDWLHAVGVLAGRFGHERFDYHRNVFALFRVDPAPPTGG